MKKIAFIYSAASYGGMIKNISQVINILANNSNFQIMVVCLESKEQAVSLKLEQKIQTIYLDCDRKFQINKLLELKRTFKEKDINLISAHGYKANVFIGILKLCNLKTKTITIVHGWVGKTLKLRLYQKLAKYSMRFYDVIIVLTQRDKNLLLEQKSKASIYLVNNAIDASNFLEQVNQNSNSNRTDQTVLGVIARLSEEKDQGTIINALKSLPENVCLELIGGGESQIHLKQQVSKQGLDDRVVFRGFIKELPKAYANIDIFVSASLLEGQPNSVLEAAASNTLMILSDIDEHRAMFSDKAAIFFQAGDSQDLATKIMSILGSENNNYLENAYREVINKFSLEIRAKELVKIYSDL